VRKSLAILVLGLLLTGAGCPTAEPVAAPTPAPVTETPAQPVQGDVNAFAVANGTLSHASFTIVIPKDARAEGGSYGRVDFYPVSTSDLPKPLGEGQYFVQFMQSTDVDAALKSFGTEFKTRKGAKLADRTVVYGTEGHLGGDTTSLIEQYFAIYNGDLAVTITMFADTKSGMDAARAFVATIHWTDQN